MEYGSRRQAYMDPPNKPRGLMNISPKKILLPHFELTEVTDVNDPDATMIAIPGAENDVCQTYFVRKKVIGHNGLRRDGKPTWHGVQYNCFPIVLDSFGVPWAEANVYILNRLEGVTDPVMTTYTCIADDLASYRRFLDNEGIDWLSFPTHKLARPTYRFNGHLKFAVAAGDISISSARRQMGTVIKFYRTLINEKVFTPDNQPWKESDVYIDFKDSRGFTREKKIITTDVSIKGLKQHDPYDGCIDDGGKLRPLPLEEQEWLVDALVALGNTEMTLIHLMGILTGARIQTVLTFQVKHVSVDRDCDPYGNVRIPVGPGTGIDTKNNKQLVLHVPDWFYKILHNYSHSPRAKKRRKRAAGGDHEGQYLFLSVRGAPLYQNKENMQTFDADSHLRHVKSGQGVRQFITERVIPFIREKHSNPKFKYQFHDTRATAGMNWTDHQLKLVEQGKATLHEAREFVKTRMGHESSATTDRYLQYRQNLKIVRWAGTEYESHLKVLMDSAMKGFIE